MLIFSQISQNNTSYYSGILSFYHESIVMSKAFSIFIMQQLHIYPSYTLNLIVSNVLKWFKRLNSTGSPCFTSTVPPLAYNMVCNYSSMVPCQHFSPFSTALHPFNHFRWHLMLRTNHPSKSSCITHLFSTSCLITLFDRRCSHQLFPCAQTTATLYGPHLLANSLSI